MRVLQPDDAVVTPSGKHAQVVVREDDGYCTIRYLDPNMRGPGAVITVHELLLRLIKPGREAPPPVRIGLNGRRT